MSTFDISKRLQKLRDMRVKLCKKEQNWEEAFQARDWIVSQLNDLTKIIDVNDTTKEDIKDRVEDILCVFEPNDGEEDD